MDFNLNNLVSSRVLDPCTPFPENLQQPEMRHIAVLEPENPGFVEALGEQTLLFIPHGCLCRLTAEHIQLLAERSCAVVRYRDDASPTKSPDALRPAIPQFLIPEGSDVSATISLCYKLAYSGMQRLAEASLETMERLSKELLHHKGQGESIIRIAAELLECPVAFVTSDFHLQSTHDTSGYLVLNPFCTEDSFNWESALENFQLSSAAYHSCLAEGFNGNPMSGYLCRNEYCRKQGCRIFIFPITDAGNCSSPWTSG